MVDDGAEVVVVEESDTLPIRVHLLVLLLAETGVKARNATPPTPIPLRMLLPVPARLAEDGLPPIPALLLDVDDTRPPPRVPARRPVPVRGHRLDVW